MNPIPCLSVRERANKSKSKIQSLEQMAFEIPLDQIKELQFLLRKEVNLSWYEPEKEDPFTPPKLPSVAETIAGLDPSPPYLRCKHCKAKLLRGLQSSICIFCGTNPLQDLPPDPIKFKDTVGYRFLLDSLQLDGSVNSWLTLFILMFYILGKLVSEFNFIVLP